ncbi:MAG TPA: tRNA dimethylallyltransferase, partial [Nocardioides sp.]
ENGRRIVRALEVVEITGRPFTASLPTLEYADPHTVQIGVDIDRPTLDERIAARVDAMFEAGFVDEVERLLAEGLAEGRTAGRAIGYREVAAYLAGELGLEEARERTITATRRFARRQDSWFRKDPRITWIRHDDPELVDRAVSKIGQAGGDGSPPD